MPTASQLAHAKPMVQPRVVCLDLDTFFVSVERVLDPSLEGKPVVVGGKPGERGVVTAASYEVRKFGVKSGMSLVEAGKLAPDAIYLPTRADTYVDYAERVREIAGRMSPVVIIASIDEMFLDFSGCEKLYARDGDTSSDNAIERAVGELCTTIHEELGLPSSAGIATSKAVAKICSSLAKPRGVMLVPAGVEAAVLAPLPVRAYPGIGPVGEAKLHAAGYMTLGDIAAAPVVKLREIFGAWAPSIAAGAHGHACGDLGRERPAFQEHDPQGESLGTISNERTFHADVHELAAIESVLCGLCERVCWRARKRGIKARTVTLKLRYADFHTLSRAKTVSATASELELYPVLKDLLTAARTRDVAVRLLGVRLSNLGHHQQLSLFGDYEELGTVVDDIRERYGFSMVGLATQFGGSGKTLVGRGAVGRSGA